jgi:hypothetical protein
MITRSASRAGSLSSSGRWLIKVRKCSAAISISTARAPSAPAGISPRAMARSTMALAISNLVWKYQALASVMAGSLSGRVSLSSGLGAQ